QVGIERTEGNLFLRTCCRRSGYKRKPEYVPNPVHTRGETRLTENHRLSRHRFLSLFFSEQIAAYSLPLGRALSVRFLHPLRPISTRLRMVCRRPRLCKNAQEPTMRRIVFSIAHFLIAATALFLFRLTKSRKTFYVQVECLCFHTAWTHNRPCRG